uniref:Very-long-chain (3R)-3-hydroxyacyl-CoA dehydratase n=1 Tax=Daucus carota subsp. sativus TaxID=79200 RepID=A0A162AAL4_DAUCS
MGLLSRIYLTIYNWTVFIGWFQVLFIAVKTLIESGHEHVYDAVEKPLLLAQSAAFLEIGSRLYVTWGILYSFPEVRTHILVSSLVISWGITEVIRYSFFGTKEAFGSAPSFLLWLRYSAFLLLYPTGISSEVGLIYVAMPYMKVSEKYCIRMPNKWNSSFDYFSAAIATLGLLQFITPWSAAIRQPLLVQLHAQPKEESSIKNQKGVVEHEEVY